MKAISVKDRRMVRDCISGQMEIGIKGCSEAI